ncbi:MAG: hypothetical protein ACI4NM_01260 [Bullifex sp.]
MKKILFFEGDAAAFLEGKKAALLRFSDNAPVLTGVLTKDFTGMDAKRGFEQLKRFVSSAAFDAIVLDGFAPALSSSSHKDEIIMWLNDHSSEPDFPMLLITGGGGELLPGLNAEFCLK